MFKKNPVQYTTRPYLSEPLDQMNVIMESDLSDFDYDGFRTTSLENLYLYKNEIELVSSDKTYNEINVFNQYPVRQIWYSRALDHPSIYLNKANVYTRYTYTGRALFELEKFSVWKPELYKLIFTKPKWAIEFDLDWVDDTGVYKLLYIYKQYDECALMKFDKLLLDDLFKDRDWERDCRILRDHYNEWKNLTFEEQNTYKKRFLNIYDL
jgi:hypothetical protein